MKKKINFISTVVLLLSLVVSQSLIASEQALLPHVRNKKVLSSSMFAVLPSLRKINKKIIALVQEITYGKTPVEVVSELTDFYKNTQEPLLRVIIELIRQKKYLKASIDVAQLLMNAIPDGMSNAAEIEGWISDLKEILSCVDSLLAFVKNNSQRATSTFE